MDDRVDLREAVEMSDAKVFRERAETFLLGGRSPYGDPEYADFGRLVNTFLFLLGVKYDDRSAVSTVVEDPGLRWLMKPYRSTSAPSTFSQSSSPPARSNPFPNLSCRGEEELSGRAVVAGKDRVADGSPFGGGESDGISGEGAALL